MGPFNVVDHSQDVTLADDLRILSEALGNVPGGGGAGGGAGGDAANMKAGPIALANAITSGDDPFMPGCASFSPGDDCSSDLTHRSSSELTQQHSGSDLDPSDEPPLSTAMVISESADGQPQCWGAQMALDGTHCVPGYTRGSKHQKNKFCEACRQCISIPASRIVALDNDEHGEFLNSWAGGLWARHASGFEYRVVNHTALCSGPRLLIFNGETPKRPWAPVPESWVSNGMIHFFVSKGTLVPIAAGQEDLPGEPNGKSQVTKKRRRLTDATSGRKSEQAVKVEPWVQEPEVSMSPSCNNVSSFAPMMANNGLLMQMEMPLPGAPAVQCPPSTQYDGSSFGKPGWSSAVSLQGATQPSTMGATLPLVGLGQIPMPPSKKVAHNGLQVAAAPPTGFGMRPVIAPPALAPSLPSGASTAANCDINGLASSWFDRCSETEGWACGFSSSSNSGDSSGSVRPVTANAIDSERQRRLVEWMESSSRARQEPFILPVVASQ